eukprot:Amastigsp_a676917_51.p2 type:complete len:128 gc:universal Amastigsp_a676917_51:298-681(+)
MATRARTISRCTRSTARPTLSLRSLAVSSSTGTPASGSALCFSQGSFFSGKGSSSWGSFSRATPSRCWAALCTDLAVRTSLSCRTPSRCAGSKRPANSRWSWGSLSPTLASARPSISSSPRFSPTSL